MELSAYSQDGIINLYFLVLSNGTTDGCSKYLQYAFQACKENGLDPVWLNTEECLKKQPTKQDVFICDPFEGDAYSYLLSGSFKCVRVLGPRCLLTCLHNKKPVPELPPPLHNMAMHELVITSTGFEKEEKLELQQCIQKMSGIYSNSYHEGITHLVAKMVGSKKYMVAVEKETPIMTGEWVQAVWKATTSDCEEDISAIHEQFFKYTCPVFQGLVICVSQMPRCEKDALQLLIGQNGGIYSANLEMTVTSVLITSSSEGEKYKHALQWRIPCLTQEWIHDSIEHGHALPMDEYKLIQKKSSTPTHDQSRVPPDVSICSTIMNDSIINRYVNETATGDHDTSIVTKDLSGDSRISLGLQNFKEVDMQSVMKAGLFLDGCKVFVSGFEKNLSEKVRRVMNAGGATRFNQLTEAVSHIVIGKFVKEDLSVIESWNVKPLVVTAGWLVECIKQKRQVDENDFLLKKEYKNMTPPKLSIDCVSRMNIPNPSINDTCAETFIEEDLVNMYLGDNKKEKEDTNQRASLDCSTLPDSQQIPDGIFKGKLFFVSGYVEDIEDQLIGLISSNGGELTKLTYPKAVDYSIITIDGEGVPHPKAVNYVTHIFIEDCLEQEMLVPVKYFHLPFVWPSDSAILDGCCIATSTYKGKERLVLSHIATRMSAIYQDMFAKKDNPNRGIKCSTHLLCPLPEGEKYSAATKWGVHAITKDWLLKCAEKGQRVLESNFNVASSPSTDVDGIVIFLSMLGKKFELSKESIRDKNMGTLKGSNADLNTFNAPTPLNKNIRALRQHHPEFSEIKTPDIETMRRLYPTPGGPPLNNSLDNMSTPETPYGSTWYQNPSSHVRKAFKRALDRIPDDPNPHKKPFTTAGTPEDVYFKKLTANVKEMLENRPVRKPSSSLSSDHSDPINQDVKDDGKENCTKETEHLNNMAADIHGPLTGVIIYASRKLADMQQELYKAVESLGGDYRWTYDKQVTHFVHTGRMNDTNKEFRIAREEHKYLVCPEWVWMCKEEKRRIDEALFPHTHNPKLSLSIVTTRNSPLRRKKRGKGKRNLQDQSVEGDGDEGLTEDNEESTPEKSVSSEIEESDEKRKEVIYKQLEEIEAITGAKLARRASTNSIRNKSLSDKHKNTPPRQIPQSFPKPASNTETESQNTAITWDDPQEREARAKLEGALVGDTQDIIAQNMGESSGKEDDRLQRKSSGDEDNAGNENSFNSYSENSQQKLRGEVFDYIFVLSGMNDEQKQNYSDIIICLEGTLCKNQQSFDPSATHIITLKPSRSEKHLAAIASGKWILHTSFLDASQKCGRFVEEEEHEWGNKKALYLPTYPPDSTETKLAAAAHRWRVKLGQTKNGAFYRMTVVLYSSKERVSAFTRLVEAGQGTVVSNPSDLSEITHCFVELTKADRVDLAAFAEREIPCLLPIYLNDMLVNFPPPDEMDCCIPEYKEIMKEMAP